MRRAVAISRQDADAVRWTGQIALANALMMTGQYRRGHHGDEGRRWATCRRPRRCTRSSTAIARSSSATWRAASRLLTVRQRRDADRIRLRSRLGRAVTAAHVLDVRALCEVHGGRPEAALQTVRRLDACRPSRSATSPPTRPTCWPGPGRRRATARRNGRRADGSRTSRGSPPGPAVMATVEAVHGVHAARRGEPSPAGRGRAVRARAALRAGRRAVVRRRASRPRALERARSAVRRARAAPGRRPRRRDLRAAARAECSHQLTLARARGGGARRRRASRTARSASASTSRKAPSGTTCRRRSPSSASRAGPSSAGSCRG